jgi:hypothetical protein
VSFAWRKAQRQQHALFELRTDCGPAAECTATGRYHEPTFLDLMAGDAE